MDRDEAEKLLEAGPGGVEEWNRLRAAGETIPNLDEFDFSAKELNGINLGGLRVNRGCFWGTELNDADFRGAKLEGADFSSVQARGACFAGSDLRCSKFGIFSIGLGHSSTHADLSKADLSDAILRGADLTETHVFETRFCRADLTDADLCYTELSMADMTDAILEGVTWQAPSPCPPIHFGNRLREEREARGISPAELAARVGCGLTGFDISRIVEKQADRDAPYLLRCFTEVVRTATDIPPERP